MLQFARALLFAGLCALFLMGPAGAQGQTSDQESQPQTESSEQSAPDTGSNLDALIKILSDDASRQQLIDRLNGLNAQGEGAVASDVDIATEIEAASKDQPTFARQVANATKQFAESFYAGLVNFMRDLAGMRFVLDTMSPEKAQRLSAGAINLLGTALVAGAVIVLGTVWLRRTILPRIGAREEQPSGPAVIRLFAVALSELAVLLVAYAMGYLVSIGLFGAGQMNVEQSLFLNAFVTVGLGRIVLSILLHPARGGITILRLPRAVSKVLYSQLLWIVAFAVFGLLFIVPIANSWANFATGRALRIIVISIVAVWGLLIIRNVAAAVRKHLNLSHIGLPDTQDTKDQVAADTFWLGAWQVTATIVTLGVWVGAIAEPQVLVSVIGRAGAQIAVAIVISILALRLLSAFSAISLPLPRNLQRLLPDLKPRIQRLLPAFTNALSALVLLITALVLADAVNLIDLRDLLAQPATMQFISNVLIALGIVLASLIIWLVVSSMIDGVLRNNLRIDEDDARRLTILALFKNAFAVFILVFGAMTALSQLGLDIAPLLAGAGVVGLAIGFGAQKLVQDVITGIFIQIENAINVGDVITVTGITGSVEKLTIRSVGIRDLDGTFHLVPFSAVDTVSNFTRSFAYHVAVIGVAYKENVQDVKDAMQEAFKRLKADERGAGIVDELEMHGVVALADSSVNIRARIKTLPGQQWGIGRAYTEIIKQVFDERGIEIPYPHRTMILEPTAAGELSPPKPEEPPQSATEVPATKKPGRRKRTKEPVEPPSSDEADGEEP